MRSVHENQPLDVAYKLSNVLVRLALQAAKKPVWILLFRKIVVSRLYLRMGGMSEKHPSTLRYLTLRHFRELSFVKGQGDQPEARPKQVLRSAIPTRDPTKLAHDPPDCH